MCKCNQFDPYVAINRNNRETRKNVSCHEYYCYKLHIRAQDKYLLLHISRLLQQYVIDVYIKIETSRLEFYGIDENQYRLRIKIYQGLLDSVS